MRSVTRGLFFCSLGVMVAGAKRANNPCDACNTFDRCGSDPGIAFKRPCASCDLEADCNDHLDLQELDEECATCGDYCKENWWTANLHLECFTYCTPSGISDCVYNIDLIDCDLCEVLEVLDCEVDCKDYGCLYDEDNCSCSCDCSVGQGGCQGNLGCAPLVCGELEDDADKCECRECTDLEDCGVICGIDEVCRSIDGRTCQCTSCECACFAGEECHEIVEGECECVLECNEDIADCDHCDGADCIAFYPDDRPAYCACVLPTCGEDSCKPSCTRVDETCQAIDGVCQCSACICFCLPEEECVKVAPDLCDCVLKCGDGHPDCDDCLGDCLPIDPRGDAEPCVCVLTTTEEPVTTFEECDAAACNPSCEDSYDCLQDNDGNCHCMCVCVGDKCDCQPTDEVAGGEDDEDEEDDPENSVRRLAPVLSTTAILVLSLSF